MPIHNWPKAPVGLYHHFHQQWTGELCNALNSGVLPKGYYALVDQRAVGLIPDVLTLRSGATSAPPSNGSGGLAVAAAPPKVRHTARESDAQVYAARANRIAVRDVEGDVVAIIEVVSPGNKESRHALRSFVDKAMDFLRRGVNLLIIDLFPPTPRDPQGIHKAIWDEVQEELFELPPDKPLTLAAYVGGVGKQAYVEFAAAGDPLPAMPLFLSPRYYVPAPLEASYQATWDKCPAALKEIVGRAR